MKRKEMEYNIDLALFLIIISVIVFCFVEMGMKLGIVSLIIGFVILLGWTHHRSKLLG